MQKRANSFVYMCCLLLCFSFMMVLNNAAKAQGIGLEEFEPLRILDLMPEQEFESKTQLFEEEPLGDPNIAYSVRLPLGWEQSLTHASPKDEAQNVTLDILGTLARYDGPPSIDGQSYFTVQALELDYEITAQSWFFNHVREHGYTVYGANIISDYEVQALYIHVENAISYVVRIVARINGPRIIVARYLVPQVRQQDEKLMQEQGLLSFTLLNADEKNIEMRKSFSFLDQSYFEFPSSWILNADNIVSIDRMKAEIINSSESGDLNGRIRMYVISRLMETSLKEEVQTFMSKFDVKNYSLGPVIERHDFPHHSEMEFAKTEVYRLDPAVPTLMPYEFWATLLQNDDYYYIVTMLTPSRKKDFFLWSRNAEGYKVVLESMRRYEY